MKKNSSGSVLILLLVFIALLSLLFFIFTQTLCIEKRTSISLAFSYQASEAAESGLAAAIAKLSLTTSNNPNFLVGMTNIPFFGNPVVMIGATNLTNSEQLTLLICGDTNSSPSVDLNKNHSIAATGSYNGPWVVMTNAEGHPSARYAYVILDEQARLTPSLHNGLPRTDPINWDHGPEVLSLTLSNNLLLSPEEASAAHDLAANVSTLEGFEPAFASDKEYNAKKIFLTPTSVSLPDLIPATLPEGGQPKYNLNDLVTNSLYGTTATERAYYLAAIIDNNLPHFKERDPSLKNSPTPDQLHYLNRLAACIVDYISPQNPPTLVNGGEPAGQSLTPLVTQTAERCRVLERTSNSVTIENQYFVQLWNPYTTTIPGGGVATFSVQNRQRLVFGTAPATPFQDYTQQSVMGFPLHPNESGVIAFPTVTQTWTAPTNALTSEFPHWQKGPEGNAIPTQHQPFTFFWNGALVTMSRRPPVAPGLTQGGLEHDAQSLTNSLNCWQCNFIPTEKDESGNFRFVGDPRENYLSNYLWKSYSSTTSYLENTRWKGAMSDASPERLFSPATSWIRRDFVPMNPVSGNKPSSLAITPDQITSPYNEARDAMMAPLVLRKGPMNSIVELGNVNDPAQADDLGTAPNAGSSDDKSSIYASGGGRTLRIGAPEFSYWDVPGKRAIELLDLFTVATTNNSLAAISYSEKEIRPTMWRKGLINVNTAPHEVLTALFNGITPTSDQRFTSSTITVTTAEALASLLEEHRPYEKLSDLEILTPLLANATTYTPSLSINIAGEAAPLAGVFDRAREEGFGKMISLCSVQSRAFRVYILGQALTTRGKPTGEALLEASIVLEPSKNQQASDFSSHESSSTPSLFPIVQKREWLR
jgi:Tfp pilus assembly protein PilX